MKRRMLMLVSVLLAPLTGCEGEEYTMDYAAFPPDSDEPEAVDFDEDGFDEIDDCDDEDPDVNPDADEVCDDSIDNDCDGDVDSDDTDCA